MKTFDLPTGVYLKLLKVTPHKEPHGPDMIQAVSLRLEWCPLENTALNMVAEGLQDALLYDPEDLGQMSAEAIPSIKKHRRCPGLKMPVELPKAEFAGYTLEIEHGIDETTSLALYALKMTKFQATVSEGGVATIRWSANSSRQITPGLLGELCALEGTEIKVIKLEPPSTADAIDGSQAAFDADHPDMFDGPDDADGEGSDTDIDPVLEAMKAAPRTARGRAKTQAALQEGAQS